MPSPSALRTGDAAQRSSAGTGPTRWRVTGAVAVGVVGLGAVAALAVGVVALLVGGGVQLARPGLPDAGDLTRWGLPLVRVLGDVAAACTVGLLAGGAMLTPNPGRDLLEHTRRLVRLGGHAGAAWCAAAVTTALLTISDVTGVPLLELPDRVAPGTLWDVSQTRALLEAAVAAAVVAIGARLVRTHLGAAGLAVLAVLALGPALFTGHAGHGASPVLASAGLAVHVVAASLWVGGLATVLVLARASGPVLTATVSRYSTMALVCYLLVGVSGLGSAWLRLGGVPDLTTGYGTIMLGKIVVFGALGAVGVRHRRRTVPLVRRGQRGALVRLVLVESAVMLLAITLAVALARTPVP